MNVCILSYFYSPIYPGNGTRYPLILAESLARIGHNVKVITIFPQRIDGTCFPGYKRKILTREYENGIQVVRVWVPALQHSGFSRRLILYCSFMLSSMLSMPLVGKADIILGTSPEPPFLIVPGFLYSKLKKAPYILTLGDLWPDAVIDLGVFKSKFLLGLLKTISVASFTLAQKIFVITSAIKNGMLKYGVAPEKISVVELGVDTKQFHPKQKNTNLENGNFKDKFVIMYSGIFGLTYDFDTLLEAARILESSKNFVFVIRGHGECEEYIRKKIQALSISNVFLLPPVDANKIIEYLNLADLFVIPMKNVKLSETAHPSKLFEFLACGKPVVCCARGELAKLIREGQCGLSVEPQNPSALAEALETLYLDPERRIAMGARGRQFVIDKFSYSIVGKKMQQTFDEVQ